MKSHFDDNSIPYTGSELAPLRNYIKYGLLGDSVLAWIGPCRVELSEMVDGEDVRASSTIASDKMLHFVMEIFDVPLTTGVLLQRLFADMVITELKALSPKSTFVRSGDDIFWDAKKLNISIATRSINSVLIHVGINVENNGTPIPTCALSDFNVNAKSFALKIMETLKAEWQDILDATHKVRCL
ncbi:MAG: DUF366 family protein [Bdellovibrionaceae bacterium]|nr:DUF366 family protein [Pseudobdellovibrionaceae bacterium]